MQESWRILNGLKDAAIDRGILHEGRHLYTESDASLRGAIIGANYVYYFRIDKNWTLGPMLGFRYQEFKYDIYGYRVIYWTKPVYGEGKGLHYRVIYERKATSEVLCR